MFGAVWLNKMSVGKGCLVVKDVLGCQGSIWSVVKGPGRARLSRIASALTSFPCAPILMPPSASVPAQVTAGSPAALLIECEIYSCRERAQDYRREHSGFVLV